MVIRVAAVGDSSGFAASSTSVTVFSVIVLLEIVVVTSPTTSNPPPSPVAWLVMKVERLILSWLGICQGVQVEATADVGVAAGDARVGSG